MKIQLSDLQLEGAKALCAHPRAALADEPGVGKTYQVLHAARELGCKKVLIVCGKTVKQVWATEAKKYLGITPRELKDSSPMPESGWWMTTPQWPSKGGRQMRIFQQWDLVVCDEAHMFKNPKSGQTRRFFGDLIKQDNPVGLLSKADRIWWITGTPLTNSAADAYTVIRVIRPDLITYGDEGAEKVMSFHAFQKRYCQLENGFGASYRGFKNEKELAGILQQVWTRRTKKDDGHDVTVNYQALPVDFTLKGDLKDGESVDSGLSDAAFLQKVAKEDKLAHQLQGIESPRIKIGLHKANLVLAQLKQLGRTEKLVIFCSHTAVFDFLRESLGVQSVGINGASSLPERKKAVYLFQEDPRVRFFIGNLKAASEAITLTAAGQVWFIETGYIPATVHQAICRINRRGQERKNVLAVFPVCRDPIDRRVTRIMLDKSIGLGKLMDGGDSITLDY